MLEGRDLRARAWTGCVESACVRTCLRLVTVPAIRGFRCARGETGLAVWDYGSPVLPNLLAPPPPRELYASGMFVRSWDPLAQVRRAGTASELSRFPRHPPHPVRSAHSASTSEFAGLLLSPPRVLGLSLCLQVPRSSISSLLSFSFNEVRTVTCFLHPEPGSSSPGFRWSQLASLQGLLSLQVTLLPHIHQDLGYGTHSPS